MTLNNTCVSVQVLSPRLKTAQEIILIQRYEQKNLQEINKTSHLYRFTILKLDYKEVNVIHLHESGAPPLVCSGYLLWTQNNKSSWRKLVKQTCLITMHPAHSLQGNTAWTRDEKEQSSGSRGKVQQQRRSVAEHDAGMRFYTTVLTVSKFEFFGKHGRMTNTLPWMYKEFWDMVQLEKDHNCGHPGDS